MKTIRVKKLVLNGYIEAFVENMSYGGWMFFEPDPRKKKHHCAKYWWRIGSFGNPNHLCDEDLWRGRDETVEPYITARSTMKEAIRRWEQRYKIYGELGNTRMPVDPDIEPFVLVMSDFVKRYDPR